MNRKHTYPVEKNCEYCTEKFLILRASDLKKKFCSASCRVSDNNSKREYNPVTRERVLETRRDYSGKDNPNYRGGGLEFTCGECKILFRVPKHTIDSGKHAGLFCSKDCYSFHKFKNRMKIDQKRLYTKYRRIFSNILKTYSEKTSNRWLNIFGYTRSELIVHLEKGFKEGMSWNNYGLWHVDHIVPVSFFDFENEDDQELIECWKLENLQPLWAEENIKKGGMNTKLNKEKYGK